MQFENITVVSDASAIQRVLRSEGIMLAARIASALVLIPLVLAIVWVGGFSVVLLAALAAGIMAWEWARLVGYGKNHGEVAIWIAAATGAIIVLGEIGLLASVIVLLGGLFLAASVSRRFPTLWFLSGYFWVILGCAGFVYLRLGASGRYECLWILAIVWAVDTSAYTVGKIVGGPRMAPRVSPNKTWSGLIGGVAAAALVGVIIAKITGVYDLALGIGVLSAGLAIVEQMGDMAESYAKRHFGVKDAGSLIPGHGGLLDRLDGMLAVVAAVVVLELIGMKVW